MFQHFAVKHKNLVVVRAGRASLHPQWLVPSAERNWDIIVSVYDSTVEFETIDCVQLVYEKGGKWDGLYPLFADGKLLSRYEYIWLPDDDIATDAKVIDQIFNTMRHYQLAVAQPSLSRNSYYSHFALLNCPEFSLRFSNFIEIMVPCVRSDVLRCVFGDISESMSGFGLDYIWCRLEEDNRFKAAIIDDVSVHHTRPVGSALRKNMSGKGISAEAEEAQLQRIYNCHEHIRPLIYAALNKQQQILSGTKYLGWKMAFQYVRAYSDFNVQESPFWKILQLIRRQMTREPTISQLKRINEQNNKFS